MWNYGKGYEKIYTIVSTFLLERGKEMKLLNKSFKVIKEEGISSFFEKAKNCINYRMMPKINRKFLKVESSTENGMLKNDKSVFIFGSVPYYDIGGGQRSAQLAKTFNKMGYSIHYIYAYEASDGSNKQNIFIPCSTHEYIENIDEEYITNSLTEENIFIFELPHVKCEKYLDMANRYSIPVVYEHIDNWETSLGSMFFNIETYRNFINKADLLVATSKLLQERLENFIKEDSKIEDKNKKVEYLANAVDSELFESMIERKVPDDLVKGEKTLLYYGSLWGDWFDWKTIEYVARKRSNYSINLIGDYSGIKNKIKTLPSNIHFLGLKKQGELPAYLKHSDIALIPFKNDEIGKYVSPLKIFEYICAGKIVVSTALPDIENYPNVYCSDKKEDWLKFITEEYEVEDFNLFISENNWYSRCRHIVDKTKKEEEKISISVILLNRNNKKVIGRCIESLINYNSYNYEIIVVDNQSTDGSFEMLQDRFGDKIKLIKNKKNGCSSGRNLGVKNAKGNHIVFLDSDQWILDYNWLDNGLDIMKNRKEIGAVGWSGGWFNKNSLQGPTVDYFPDRAIKPAKKFRADIAYLATSGFVMKKDLFDMVDGFDEYYDPTCFEDTDLSLKIRHAGYELAYCPYMSIFHLPHQTTKSGSPEHVERMKKNGEYFMTKWNKIDSKLLQYYYKEY